jgi:predicted nucleotidyltransferase
MDMLNEGFFIITEEELVFEIKGSVHPQNRAIAYLRYVPDGNGDRVSTSGERYRKIYDLKQRESFLETNHPEYLWIDPFRERRIQSVPRKQIMFVLNPIDAIGRMRDRGIHLSSLEKDTLELVDILIEISGITTHDIGVTGSQLVGLSTPESDIDLVVYGEANGRLVYHALKNGFDSIPKLQRYSNGKLKNHVEFRWGTSTPWKGLLSQIEQNKVLQGLFGKREFFIRLVKHPQEIDYRYGERSFSHQGEGFFICSILDHAQSIFTPCEYLVNCDEKSDLKRIVSYRGRFTEQVSSGQMVEVKGRIERVISKEIGSELQLVVGESNTDFLVPIEGIEK